MRVSKRRLYTVGDRFFISKARRNFVMTKTGR